MSAPLSPRATRMLAAIEIGCGVLAAGYLVLAAWQSEALAVGDRSVGEQAFPYVVAVLVLLLLGGRGVRHLRAARQAGREVPDGEGAGPRG